RERRADVDERQLRGERLERVDEADVHGPDERADHERDDEERSRADEPERRRRPPAHRRGLRCARAPTWTGSTRTMVRDTKLLPRGFEWRRPAGLLARGSPSAAFPALASGVVAEGTSPHSGGTAPDSHRIPRPFAVLSVASRYHGRGGER